jgi:hypothetical protein
MKGNIMMITAENEKLGLTDIDAIADFKVLHYRLNSIDAGYLVQHEEYKFMNLSIGGAEYPIEYNKEDWTKIKEWLHGEG